MNSEDAAVKAVVAERLIGTVARCFYGDTTVVVLDALIREKFIREEEMGPRLRLKEKDWRKVVNQLEEELLIQSEKVLMEDMRQPSVYYIDYQMFVDVVRYRIYLMKQKVDSATTQEISEVKYKCPTCKRVIGMTEAMRCRSKDYKFICSECCPHDDFRQHPAEFDWILQSEDNAVRISSADNLKTKMIDALKKSDLHEGILDDLGQLKDVPLTRNLPSDNMSMGIRNTKIEDEEMENAVRSNTRRAVIGKKGRHVLSVEAKANDEGNAFELSLDDDGHGESAIAASTKREEDAVGSLGRPLTGDSEAAKTLGILPEFLDRSGVYGSNAAYNIKSLNSDRTGIDSAPYGTSGTSTGHASDGEGEGDEEDKAKKRKTEGETVLIVGSTAQGQGQGQEQKGSEGDNKEKEKEEEDVDWDDDVEWD
jgi:transcription initiation factor IIE alpha subunit